MNAELFFLPDRLCKCFCWSEGADDLPLLKPDTSIWSKLYERVPHAELPTVPDWSYFFQLNLFYFPVKLNLSWWIRIWCGEVWQHQHLDAWQETFLPDWGLGTRQWGPHPETIPEKQPWGWATGRGQSFMMTSAMLAYGWSCVQQMTNWWHACTKQTHFIN